jgi:hypothetical protein
MIRIECNPDEAMLLALGVSKRNIIHNRGKSQIFDFLIKNTKCICLVDEDPLSPHHYYEKELTLVGEDHNVMYYTDSKRKNTVFILKPRLEEWFINLCKLHNIDLNKEGLSDNPGTLHEILNEKTETFQQVLKKLLKKNDPALKHLQSIVNV